MYLDFHGFREKPFSLTPDPRFIFLSKNHREAFAHLLYGIDNRVGFIALTGEVGTGKTTVLRSLLSQLDAGHYCTALIFNPSLSPTELLQTISRELRVPMDSSNHLSALDALNLFLLQQNAEGRTVVLVIDEAQALEAPVLEQIRLISNLETDREKLVQIVLSGQPEFMRILGRDEMRQLNQRIAVRYHLQPMDLQDTVDYVHHRLNVAGGGKVFFSRGALNRIHRYSRGLPRLINTACDRALLVGYTRDTTQLSPRIAAAGIRDLRSNAPSYTWKRRLILIPAIAMVLALVVGSIHFKWIPWQGVIDSFRGSPPTEATEEQARKDAIARGEELSRAMIADLGEVPESESARRAFNTLTTVWNVPPVADNSPFNALEDMGRAALERNLRLYRFSGNLGALLRLGYPAVLELALPGIPGKRFLSLVGRENEELWVDPPIAGRRSVSFSELERHWSGHGVLLWKDPLNLFPNVLPGSKGGHVKQLQGLLKETGNYNSAFTGVYDKGTLSAVRDFQSSRGIEQDGIAGDQTLMLLYRSFDRFEVPRLTAGQK